MAQRNNNQQTSGQWGPAQGPRGMLGSLGGAQNPQQSGAGMEPGMAYSAPWMQAGKWSQMGGPGGGYGAGAAPAAAQTAAPVATATDVTQGGTGEGTGTPTAQAAAQTGNGPAASTYGAGAGWNNNGPIPWNGTPVPLYTGLGDPMMYPGTLDSMNYPTWPDPSTYPTLNDGSSWGTPTGNNKPAYLYGVPAPTQQQMQNYIANAMPVTDVPGNDVYYALQNSLGGKTPTTAQANQAALNHAYAGAVNQFSSDPQYQQVGPGGLTYGQMNIMNLQKGGLLPKDLFK